MWLLGAAQSPGIDLGPALQQIGIGILIAVPIAFVAWLLWNKNNELSAQLQKVQDERIQDQKDQVTRERELVSKLGPLLAEAVKILAAAPDRFDQALNQATTAIQRQEMERLVHKIEESVEGIAKDRGR